MIRLTLAVLALVAAAPASAPRAARGAVAEGIEWLHSFEYERALAAFARAERDDPGDARAYWGQAMCYEQLLWGHENIEEARAILARMRARGALDRATPTDREWVETLSALFGSGDRPARLAAYAADMEKLAAAYPDDPDAAAFHGLALLATRARGLAGHHGGEQEQPQLAGSPEQERAAQIFGRILQTHPRHPGALHYLIHTWDDPQNAGKALAAARTYGEVVPESSHARHMPAHIFVQLGMWDEAIAADEGAAAAADAKVAKDGLPIAAADFHPLSWLVYEYTQAGRFDDARRAQARIQSAADATRDPRLLSLAATSRSRVAIEAGDWDAVRGPEFVNYEELFAVGFGAAHRGDLALAERARIRLAELAAQPRYATRRPLLEIMALQVGAVIRARSSDVEGALALLADAAARERALPEAIGPPALIKPAEEQYAEYLLTAGRRDEAREGFEGALRRARNRRASVQGLSRASEAARSSGSDGARSRTGGAVSAIVVVLIVIAARRRRARSA
jgi:tetratricopeptide (TPR) repeat protein